MSNSQPQSLYDLSMDELCHSMNETIMIDILKYYPPRMTIQIIWKILQVPDNNPHFDQIDSLKNNLVKSYHRGCKMTEVLSRKLYNTDDNSYFEFFETFGEIQQTKFVDELNFCNHFDLTLFFKLVEISEFRHRLFTIFQICIQVRGFEFPKQLVGEWTKREKQDNIYCYIEQGLKLGIFLGDAGWLDESTLVLSNTYNVISTKWVCDDIHLKLIKIIQCLTKRLSVASIGHNLIEAKIVIQRLLHNISIYENMNRKMSCISYAYVVVSQYYCVLLDFKEAWSWIIKCVDTLHEESTDNNKMFFIAQAIKLCSQKGSLDIENQLIKQLEIFHTNLCSVDLKLNNYVETLLTGQYLEMIKHQLGDCFMGYFAALDTKRNLFGYYNLHTAIIYLEYVNSHQYRMDLNDSLYFIEHVLFIMKKIGLSLDHNNMLLVKAEQLKALLLEERALKYIDIFKQPFLDVSQTVKNEIYRSLNIAEAFRLRALNAFKIQFGENSTVNAIVYQDLGKLYICQKQYKKSKKMILKSIKIHESIEGRNGPMGGKSLYILADLYIKKKKYEKAEELLLKIKEIYETKVNEKFSFTYNLIVRMLRKMYTEMNDIEKLNNISQNIHINEERYWAWVGQMLAEGDRNCTKEIFSIEKLKCIINGCIC